MTEEKKCFFDNFPHHSSKHLRGVQNSDSVCALRKFLTTFKPVYTEGRRPPAALKPPYTPPAAKTLFWTHVH